MAEITMKNIVKKYGDGFPAVNDVSLDIADGEFMILVGPVGLREVDAAADDRRAWRTSPPATCSSAATRVNDKAPRDRNLAMVFQNYALYPHLTVFENIAFPLRLRRTCPTRRSARKVRGGGRDARAHRAPRPQAGATCPAASASGWPWAGPSSARPTRSCSTSRCPTSTPSCAARCAPRSLRMQRRLGTTTVYVTHDQTEAMTLGDRVAVLRKGDPAAGRATPHELYEQPGRTCSWPGSSARRR